MSYYDVFEAVERGDLETLIHLLNALELQDVTQIKNDKGQSPLMVAVLIECPALVSVLMTYGFDPNQKDDFELSPFIAAAAQGNAELLEIMIQGNPDPFQVNRFGGTALLPSSEKGYGNVVKMMLAYGVPVNHKNRLGWSALFEAIILGDGGYRYQDIVRDLLAYGADTTTTDYDSKTVLDYAQAMHQSAIVDLLEGRLEDGYEDIRSWIHTKNYATALYHLFQKESDSKQWYYLGYVLEKLENRIHALYYYEKGLEVDPQFAYYIADLYHKQSDSVNALDYMLRGVELDKGLFYQYQMTNHLRSFGKHEEAIKQMNALLDREPNRVDFMFHKVNSLRALGCNQEAYEVLMQAHHSQPNNPLFLEQAHILQRSK